MLITSTFQHSLAFINPFILAPTSPSRVANKPWKTLKNPGFFAPGKILWKTLKLQPTPEKLCSEANFSCLSFWPCSAVAAFSPVTQGRRIYEVIRRGGVKIAYHFLCYKQPLFPTTNTKFQVKRRMKGGWVQAEDLYLIIAFFESIIKRVLENPRNLAENPLENPGKEFHFTVGHPAQPPSLGKPMRNELTIHQLHHSIL